MKTMGSIRAALMVSAVSFGTASAGHASPSDDFDLQAHRGGLGLTVESTIAAFSKGLSVGVSTLEVPIRVTKDHIAVVTHDQRVDPAKCADTAPARPGDTDFPYVGKLVKDLTFAQIETLDCGSRALPEYPRQEAVPGAKMPTLRAVLALVRQRGGGVTRVDIQAKVEAAEPEETAPREEFARIIADELRRAGLMRQAMVESFDWGLLELLRTSTPELPLMALTSPEFSADPTSKNPWLGGVALDDFGGDIVAAAKSIGAYAISPQYSDPQESKIGDPGFTLLVTPEYVAHAHRLGMKVIPWTCDDKATMAALVDAGVDGMITNYPDVLREVLAERGMALPRPR